MKRLRRQASLFRIRKTRQCPPVVCNFSYGNFDGPHDGTDKIERLIESYCVGALTPPVHGSPKQDVRVLLPAGNGNLARIHAELNDKTRSRDDKWTLDLMVLPDDRTVSTVQMWMPYNASQGVVRARISAPGGAKSGWVRASKGNYQSLQNGAGHEIARLSYTVPHMPTCRGLFTLSINPTFSLEPHVLAPAGRWTIEVEVTERQKWRPDDVIQVWIARDETLPGFKPGGRQAHFDNADYQRFDRIGAPLAHDPADSRSPVRRAGTLSGFACDESPLVIAALTQSLFRMLYSLRRENKRWREYDRFLIGENRWRAQRYGLTEGLIDFGRSEVVPFATLFEELIDLVTPHASALGCLEEVQSAGRILQTGTSADRQVAVFHSALSAGADRQEALKEVVRTLAYAFTEGL